MWGGNPCIGNPESIHNRRFERAAEGIDGLSVQKQTAAARSDSLAVVPGAFVRLHDAHAFWCRLDREIIGGVLGSGVPQNVRVEFLNQVKALVTHHRRIVAGDHCAPLISDRGELGVILSAQIAYVRACARRRRQRIGVIGIIGERADGDVHFSQRLPRQSMYTRDIFRSERLLRIVGHQHDERKIVRDRIMQHLRELGVPVLLGKRLLGGVQLHL